jgi:hypothetical protein
MPRAVKVGTNLPGDFSPIYGTEQVTLSFDFSPALASGETLLTPVVSIVLVSGTDATPAARLIGSPFIIGTFVLQAIATLQTGATYDVVATVGTTAVQILTTNAKIECLALQ